MVTPPASARKATPPAPEAPSSAIWTSDERTAVLRAHAVQHATASLEETEALLEVAELRAGLRVLDIACGPGDPTLEVAARVGPGGAVTGIDISPGALDVARERADRARISNARFQCANAESLPFPDGAFDRVVSRFGFMFFDDLPRALAEVRRVLRPDGRLAVMVWGPFDQPYFQHTVGVLLRHRGQTELPADRAVQFRYATPGGLESQLGAAGFSHVQGRTLHPKWVWKGTPEQARDEWIGSAVYNRPWIDELPGTERTKVWEEIADGFRAFFDGDSVRVPLTVRVLSAVRSNAAQS